MGQVLVERHAIQGTPEIVRLCSESKSLYNRCNFLVRQAWFEKERLPNLVEMVDAVHDLDCFKNLHNTKTAKQTIRRCLTDWSNFKKALKAYFKDKTKFVRCPRPPYYKDKLAQVTFYAETILKKPARLGMLIPTNKCFAVKSNRKFKQVVITPKTFGFVVEVQYETEKEKEKLYAKLDKDKPCSIDIGLNNLCAITSDQQRPILVDGRIVKSFNQWFNKNQCKRNSRKRYFRIENYFHHVSKLVVQNCLEHGIGRIIIGKNDGWKSRMNMGKVNNQNFQCVPFYLLLEKIKYKAELVGISVVFTEEAYTSKASFLDGDPIPEYDREQSEPKMSGRRKHRGLYVSKDGFALNADVNGSLNIRRKVFPKFQLAGIGDRSLAARPVIVNPLKALGRSIVNGVPRVVDGSNQEADQKLPLAGFKER